MGGRIRHYVTETLLWAATALGLIAIVLVFCAYFFNISIILFRTGSMEPTIPAGSAALVQEVEASEVQVGDVLTVDRPGAMPVTHRVTSIDSGEAPAERVITMQGDANESPDPAPYTITEGRVLLESVPGLANPINQLGHPYVMGGITLAASLLVGWAFWPKAGSGPPTRKPRERPDKPASKSHTPRHAGAVIGMVAVLGTAVMVSAPEQAAATPTRLDPSSLVEETITSTFITLTSVYAPSTRQNLTPDHVSEWDIGIDVEAPTEGAVRTGLSATGDLPLEVTVLTCSSRWESAPSNAPSSTGDCAGTSQAVAGDLLVPPGDDVTWIDEFSTEETPWLRLIINLPGDDQGSQASTAALRVHAEAWGEEVSTSPGEISGAEDAPGPADKASDEGPGEPHPDTIGPPLEEEAPQDEGLARTGFALWPLLVAALLSILLGRWIKERSEKRAASVRYEDPDLK